MVHNNRNDRYYIYILRCCPTEDNIFYVGQTQQLVSRLWQHIVGKGSKFTQRNPPCELVHLDYRLTHEEALKRESQLIWDVKKRREINFYLPEEFNDLFYRVAAGARDNIGGYTKVINKHIDVPMVENWQQ
jgi:predicted GIY-YIG superfamily endonuclease